MAIDLNIQGKIKKLRDYWYNDDYSLKWIEAVEKDIQRLVAQDEFKTNKAIMAIVEDTRKRISTIHKLLVYDEDMTIDQRKLLMREKSVHQFYLNRFDGGDLDKQIEGVGKILDEELDAVGLSDGN